MTVSGRGVVGLALLAAGLVALDATAQPRASDERDTLARTQPTPLEAQGRSERGEVVPLRLRFYADDDHRSGGVRVHDRLRHTLEAVNEVIEPALGVRFVIESVKNWAHTGPTARLEDLLDELEKLDPGRDVDWVVGLVAALPQGSNAIHDAGMARRLGRHFVMRGLSSYAELSAFQRAFPQLERSNPAELHMIYTRRKEHKEVVVFLHEWAHTLGALHVTERTRMLAPSYGQDTSVLAPVDLGLLAAALKDRLGARGDIERAQDPRAAQQQIVWSNLRRFVQATRAPEWEAGERDKLLALLAGGKGDGRDPAPGPGEQEIYERALALYRARKDEAAWRLLSPLVDAHRDSAQLQPLLCRLSGLPAARKTGLAACEAGLARAAPDDPGPFVDAAQAAINRQAPEEALGHVREATTRAGRGAPSASAWLSIAEIDVQLGTLHAADEAVARAGQGPAVERARAEVLRARRFFGLPGAAHPGATPLPPDREASHAIAFAQANTALSGRKLAQARKLIDAALRQFGETPGLAMLACDLAMRQARLREAHKSCAAALAGMEDLPRAHYLAGHLHLSNDDGARAAAAFRRAVDLDPSVPAFWDRLAETYTMLGRSKDLRALTAERARATPGQP